MARIIMAVRHLIPFSTANMSIISYDNAHLDKPTGHTEEEVVSLYEEWLVKHGNPNRRGGTPSNLYRAPVEDELPDSVDWRKEGAVVPVKDQGPTCGSCWTFAVIGAVEAINKIMTDKLISLSEQQLIDCDKYNGRCKGGDMEPAYEYIINHGIHSDKDYPYTCC